MYTCFASIVSTTKVNVIELYLHCNNRLNDVISVYTVLRCLGTIKTNLQEHTNVPRYDSEKCIPIKASVIIHERRSCLHSQVADYHGITVKLKCHSMRE